MHSKTKYRNIVESTKDIPLFLQNWWLDVVCGEANWQCIIIEAAHGVEAIMPYYVGQKKRFFKGIQLPLMTPFLGFHLFYPKVLSYPQKLSFERKVVEQLMSALPQLHYTQFSLSPQYLNPLPLMWQNYRVTPRISYQLALLDTAQNWSLLSNSLRRQIKKGEKHFTISTSYDATIIRPLIAQSIVRQGKCFHASLELMQNILSIIEKNGKGKAFVVQNAAEESLAAGIVVWDDSTAYYLARGGDLQALREGALSFLTWHIIQCLPTDITTFDFVGSELQAVERFIRNFGAKQVLSYAVQKNHARLFHWLYQLR